MNSTPSLADYRPPNVIELEGDGLFQQRWRQHSRTLANAGYLIDTTEETSNG